MYYVYSHNDPVTGDLIYIGMGQGDRAWAIKSRGRSEDHRRRLEELSSKGFVASDWVRILKRGLSQSDAYELEGRLLAEYKPLYNKQYLKCMSEQEKQSAYEQHLSGESYSAIARQLGYDVKTVRTHINRLKGS